MPPRHLIVVALAVALTAATGCLELEQELVLGRDNQGQFRLALAVPKVVCDAVLADGTTGWSRCLDPAAAATLFPEADGFRVVKYRVFDHGDRRIVHVEGKLLAADRALASGRLGRFTWDTDDQQRRRLRLESPAPAAAGTMAPDVARLLAGSRLRLAITVPGRIETGPAAAVGRKTAEWVFDADKDPTALASPPAIEVTYRE